MSGSKFLAHIHEIREGSALENVAVAFYDYEASVAFSFQGDRAFHAASTFKVAILYALMKAAEEGRVKLDAPLHVRNRFKSIVDGSIYRIERSRDGDSTVHRYIGRSLAFVQLAHAMITRSSNLGTNLLLDYLGVDYIRKCLSDASITGLEVRRGVEDHVAFQLGINNETTADALVRLFRVFWEERYLAPQYREKALDILFAQEFNSMIPAKLPAGTRVAHKTGEISTFCHDAGIVFVPDRQPYLLAILTETAASNSRRVKAVADLSLVVHRHLTAEHRDDHQKR